MKRIFDHIRDRLLLGVLPPERKPPYKEIRDTHWSPSFEQLMRNRLVMGAIRYETFDWKRKMRGQGDGYNYVAYIIAKAKDYEENGNHPKKHFSSIDDNKIHVEKTR